jgi:hypothetical protein
MNSNGRSRFRTADSANGGKKNRTAWPVKESGPDPNDLIDRIVDAIDYAELARDTQGLVKARRLLNNDLRQAIDVYVQDEVTKALHRGQIASP